MLNTSSVYAELLALKIGVDVFIEAGWGSGGAGFGMIKCGKLQRFVLVLTGNGVMVLVCSELISFRQKVIALNGI
ncbi:hypothetical protein V6N13_049539 [Hibiscus sabdariffa]